MQISTFKDVLIVLFVCAIVIATGVHAPSNSYAYAQMRQMGASLGMAETGNWILPRNQEGRLMRKPQLYGWLVSPVLMATGIYTDIVYFWPSVAAALVCGVMVYLIARRWLASRRGAVLAGCFWATGLQMGKLMYLGTTDMLHVLWLLTALFFVDKLLFSSSKLNPRVSWRYAAGLWASIILGALTKGWGVANITFIGFYILMVCLFKGQFKRRLVTDNIISAVKVCRLGWGVAAFLMVMIPIMIGMYLNGRDEFLSVVHYEIIQRITGQGEKPPQGSSLWPAGWLVLMTVPWSFFAVLGFVVTPVKKWISLNGQFLRPVLWIVTFVLPFSLSHGFRADYLAPCYPAVAILASLGVLKIIKYAKANRKGAVCRHVLAAFAIMLSCTLVAGAVLYLFGNQFTEDIMRHIPKPYIIQPETTVILWVGLFAGVIMIGWSVWASLNWRLMHLGYVAVISMMGIIYIDRHLLSRHARTWDGPTLIAFAEEAEKFIKDDDFALFRAEKLGTDLYMGRFGELVRNRSDLKKTDAQWLVTCAGGLVALGAADPDVNGDYIINAGDYALRGTEYVIRDTNYEFHPDDEDVDRKDLSQICFRCKPGRLGEVVELGVNKPIKSDNLGRLYLIKLSKLAD